MVLNRLDWSITFKIWPKNSVLMISDQKIEHLDFRMKSDRRARTSPGLLGCRVFISLGHQSIFQHNRAQVSTCITVISFARIWDTLCWPSDTGTWKWLVLGLLLLWWVWSGSRGVERRFSIFWTCVGDFWYVLESPSVIFMFESDILRLKNKSYRRLESIDSF